MAVNPDQLVQVRKRLYDKFDFYSKHALKIRTKKGTVEPFVLNTVQDKFHAACEDQRQRTGRVRKIILKGRQQGLSTYVSGRMYWRLSQRKARKGLVVAHVAQSTQALWTMYQRYHSQCPAMLKPGTKFSSRKELVFDALDTGLMVATAGGDSIARGETITDGHLSELAFWPKGSAKENLNGLLQAVPNEDDTELFIESTANGYNDFYELWEAAVRGENDFEPFFSPWFDTAEYRTAPRPGFERTFEEQDLVDQFGLDDAQLQWRRQRIGASGRELFMQEYPCTPEEAFIASGRPVFNPEQLNELLHNAPPILKTMDAEETAAGWVVAEHPVGRLEVYRDREDTEDYVIGADVGMGIRDGDWSVAVILDSNKRQVARWRGQVHPDYFAYILDAIGRYYHNALLGPERNNHGFLTCVRLWKDLEYPNLYMDVTEGQTEDRDSVNLGHLTNVKTRPLVIDRLRGALREKDIEVNDKITLNELKTFVVNENGKMEAENGCHDDCVFALAIANHIHPGRYQPLLLSDDDYVTAI